MAGYQVEYSSTPFLLFMAGEYIAIFLMCALTSLLFFGGWLSPVPFLPDSPLWMIAKMAFFFFISLSAYGGDDGVALMQRSTVLGMDLLKSDFGLYYTTLAILVALFVLCHRIVGSRFGRVLTGIRENPTRMEAIGYSPFRYQLTAFVISGCITAVAGVMLANQAQFVSPAFMSWHRSGELIVMVVLGGVGTLAGPIAGAVAALLLEEWLGALSEHWKLFFGVFLVLMVLFSPRGITGLLEKAGIARRQE